MANLLPKIAVLGAGSWGTALALHLVRQAHSPVCLWSHSASAAERMQQARVNEKYLPHNNFPDALVVTHDLATAVHEASDILIVVPSHAYCTTLTRLKPLLNLKQRLICATKGLDEQTGTLLHTQVENILPQHLYANLSGPSFAKEVAAGKPTAVVIATRDATFGQASVSRFNSPKFRVYLSQDIVGTEIGGAVKNVLAIATGIADGMDLGANARAAMMTRGLAEMVRLGVAAGGQYETLNGLAGLGDLVLTCTENLSRNRRFGLKIGAGVAPDQATQEIGQVVEGYKNTRLVLNLAKQLNVEMPIIQTVDAVLNGGLALETALLNLLSRTPKSEQ